MVADPKEGFFSFIGAPEIENTKSQQLRTKYATSTQKRVFPVLLFFSCTKCATSTQNGVFRSTIYYFFSLTYNLRGDSRLSYRESAQFFFTHFEQNGVSLPPLHTGFSYVCQGVRAAYPFTTPAHTDYYHSCKTMSTPSEAASFYKAALNETPPCQNLLREAICTWQMSLNNSTVFSNLSAECRGNLHGAILKNMGVAHARCVQSSHNVIRAMYHFREMLQCLTSALDSHSSADWLSNTYVKRDALISECVTHFSKEGQIPHDIFATLKEVFGQSEARGEILYGAASNLVTPLQQRVPSTKVLDETNFKDVLRVVMEANRPLTEALGCCGSVGLRRCVEDMQDVVSTLHCRALTVQCRLNGDAMVKSALDDDEFLDVEKVWIARDHFKASSQHAGVTGVVLNEEVRTMHSVSNLFLNVLKMPASAKDALTSLFHLSRETSCNFDGEAWYQQSRGWLQKLRGETESEKFAKFKATAAYSEIQTERKKGAESFLRFAYKTYPPQASFLKGVTVEATVEKLVESLKAGDRKSPMTTCVTHYHPDRYAKEDEQVSMCRQEITSIFNAFATGVDED